MNTKGLPEGGPFFAGFPCVAFLPSPADLKACLQARCSIVNRTSILLPRPSGTPSATEGELAPPFRKS